MPKRFSVRGNRARPTKAEKLLRVLSDRRWHSTKQLARRVGHTFAVYKSQLNAKRLPANGLFIDRRRHRTKRYQHEYRLVDEARYVPE